MKPVWEIREEELPWGAIRELDLNNEVLTWDWGLGKVFQQREHAVHAKALWQGGGVLSLKKWKKAILQRTRASVIWDEPREAARARQGRDWVGHDKDSLVFNQMASFWRFLYLILFTFLEEHCYNQINILKWSLWPYNMENRWEGRKDTGSKSGGYYISPSKRPCKSGLGMW